MCLPFLANLLGCSEPDASIIECGSKSALPLYIRILNAFSLRYVVVHDEDPRQDGATYRITNPDAMPHGQNRRIAEAIDPALGRLIVVRDKFETVAGMPVRARSKPMQALDHFVSKSEADLPAELTAVIRQVFEVFDTLPAQAEPIAVASGG